MPAWRVLAAWSWVSRVEREKRRPDRAVAGAALFAGKFIEHWSYDIEVDTPVLTPEEAARRVIAATSTAGHPTAFGDLRSKIS